MLPRFWLRLLSLKDGVTGGLQPESQERFGADAAPPDLVMGAGLLRAPGGLLPAVWGEVHGPDVLRRAANCADAERRGLSDRPQGRAAVEGIKALGPKPRTNLPTPGRNIYPYLLRDLTQPPFSRTIF